MHLTTKASFFLKLKTEVKQSMFLSEVKNTGSLFIFSLCAMYRQQSLPGKQCRRQKCRVVLQFRPDILIAFYSHVPAASTDTVWWKREKTRKTSKIKTHKEEQKKTSLCHPFFPVIIRYKNNRLCTVETRNALHRHVFLFLLILLTHSCFLHRRYTVRSTNTKK